MGQDRTRQDRTGQDRTEKDKTVHGTKHDTTGLGKQQSFGHDRGWDTTGQDTPKYETGQRIGHDTTRHNTTGHGTPKHGTAQDKTAQDWELRYHVQTKGPIIGRVLRFPGLRKQITPN